MICIRPADADVEVGFVELGFHLVVQVVLY